MQLQQNTSLRPYNTFAIDATAEYFAELTNADQLGEIEAMPYERHVLGGGSNILITQPVKGLVIHNKLKGIAILKEDADHVWLQAQAGEVWHELVLYAIARGWGGIENLALIPGTVGAAPMQNIGAYGAEVKDTIESVTFWHWEDKMFRTYTNAACRFGYRDSVFKQELRGKVFITSVVFRLNKRPVYNTSYGAIAQELEGIGVKDLSAAAIAQAVINIRTSKLPDPKEIGNAGSFFKNPTILLTQYDTLRDRHPGIPCYPVSDTQVKVPAGWLIEQCGWKGYRQDNIGVHAKQALVLVNYGGGAGEKLWELSVKIVRSVSEQFGIELEREVQVW